MQVKDVPPSIPGELYSSKKVFIIPTQKSLKISEDIGGVCACEGFGMWP